jgi:TPP-dependent pyruvate/acetoin dehydrogenase alpha subunit
VEYCRAGNGPIAVELDTERFFGHFEGDPQRYRGKGELDRIREQRDCLKAFRTRVLEAGLLTEEALDQVDAEVATLIEESVVDARVAPGPSPDLVLEDVYISY